MKKLAQLIIVLSSFIMLATATPVFAVDVLSGPCAQTPEAVACQEREQTPENNTIYGPNGVLTKATQLIAIVVGIAAVIVIIIGGLQYILSSGDSSRVNNAKNMILYAVIGLVIAVLAQTIVVYLLRKL